MLKVFILELRAEMEHLNYKLLSGDNMSGFALIGRDAKVEISFCGTNMIILWVFLVCML